MKKALLKIVETELLTLWGDIMWHHGRVCTCPQTDVNNSFNSIPHSDLYTDCYSECH